MSAGENELRLSRLLQDAKEDYRRLKVCVSGMESVNDTLTS